MYTHGHMYRDKYRYRYVHAYVYINREPHYIYMPNSHASCALARSGLPCFGTSTTQGRLPALLKHAAVAGACGHLSPAAVNRVGVMGVADLGLPNFCDVAVGLNAMSVCRCRCEGASACRMGGGFKRMRVRVSLPSAGEWLCIHGSGRQKRPNRKHTSISLSRQGIMS